MKNSELRKLVSEHKEITNKYTKIKNKKLKEKLKEIEHRYFHETGNSILSIITRHEYINQLRAMNTFPSSQNVCNYMIYN